ncbi:MAG TPA: Sec-independent protein translocase protein TatB [Casimicrobiaceae bacterium]|nr:Sec-independent protein translocase protein TatB [Casimicrobiaceae bacterium]
MFDVGFSEIVVIAVVALIVIGPERLPRTARMLGHLFGRLQRYVNDVKADISREMELDELRRLQREVKGAATEIEQSIRSAATDFQSGIKGVEQQLNEAASGAAPPPSVSEVPDTTSAAGPSQGASNFPSGGSAAAELANEAASVGDHHPPEEAPRQPSLPGIDKG